MHTKQDVLPLHFLSRSFSPGIIVFGITVCHNYKAAAVQRRRTGKALMPKIKYTVRLCEPLKASPTA